MEIYEYNKLKDIPLIEIINYIKTKIEKNKILRNQSYAQAAKLRDREKELVGNYPNLEILNGISEYDIKNFVRDFQIKTILK